MRDLDTPALLERYAQGDDSGYAVLFRRYQAPLRKYLAGQISPDLRHALPLDDLVQETHFQALRSLAQFTYRRSLSFFFWLCAIGRNVLRTQLRRLGRTPGPIGRADLAAAGGPTSVDLLERVAASGPSPLDEVCLLQNLHLVALALGALIPRRRQAVLLRFVEGWSNAEAAERLGMSPGAFRVLSSRAIAQLRARLAELLGEVAPGVGGSA